MVMQIQWVVKIAQVQVAVVLIITDKKQALSIATSILTTPSQQQFLPPLIGVAALEALFQAASLADGCCLN
jgi:hypothetical protein